MSIPVDLDIAGSGTLKVTARKKLKTRVTGKDYIHYHGNLENEDVKTPGLVRTLKNNPSIFFLLYSSTFNYFFEKFKMFVVDTTNSMVKSIIPISKYVNLDLS